MAELQAGDRVVARNGARGRVSFASGVLAYVRWGNGYSGFADAETLEPARSWLRAFLRWIA